MIPKAYFFVKRIIVDRNQSVGSIMWIEVDAGHVVSATAAFAGARYQVAHW